MRSCWWTSHQYPVWHSNASPWYLVGCLVYLSYMFLCSASSAHGHLSSKFPVLLQVNSVFGSCLGIYYVLSRRPIYGVLKFTCIFSTRVRSLTVYLLILSFIVVIRTMSLFTLLWGLKYMFSTICFVHYKTISGSTVIGHMILLLCIVPW